MIDGAFLFKSLSGGCVLLLSSICKFELKMTIMMVVGFCELRDSVLKDYWVEFCIVSYFYYMKWI